MKVQIKVPSMGESITEATIGAILKSDGSLVKADEEILELETDKLNQVLYASDRGKLFLSVKTQDVVKVGQVIGYIDTDQAINETASAQKAEPPVKKDFEQAVKKQMNKPSLSPVDEEDKSGEKSRFSKEDFLHGLKENLMHPSASNEMIVSKPVLDSTLERETRKKLSKIRKVIAQRLLDVQQQTAMLTTFNEVDMSAVIALREKYKESFTNKHKVKLGFMSFFVKAAVSALQAFPEVNSYIDGDDLVRRNYYDIGIAVSTDRGLIVPVVRNCDQLSFAGIEKQIEEYANKARSNQLSLDDLRGGGFTITNGGVFGSLLSTPILNPPQCAILGMHKIQKRPVVIDDNVVIRPMMYLALSYDHRILDGKEAVSFLVHIKNCIEDPTRILLEF